ncbi:MAG TPA: class D sortase [Gaiellaceae bacterium]|jgi:sortase A
MRRAARILGTAMLLAGVLTLAWTVVVWRWQDPFTALYTHWQQQRLTRAYDSEVSHYRVRAPATVKASPAAEQELIAGEARRFRQSLRRGQPLGRIVIGRIGLKMMVVNGTDHESLKRGPGRDLRTFMPGENRLVYIAGHRTTYLAPFSHIDDIEPGDYIRLEVPYATFVYRATGHRIVTATDLSVLRSPAHEQLELQACHPRFFATHRYIVYARLVRVEPRRGSPYAAPSATAVASGTSSS